MLFSYGNNCTTTEWFLQLAVKAGYAVMERIKNTVWRNNGAGYLE